MRRLFIDSSMGAAGDMLTAALVELFEDKEKIIDELNNIGVPSVGFDLEKSEKCGIVGSHMRVLIHGEEEHEHHHDECHHHHHHHHSTMADIEHIVGHLSLTNKIKEDVISVYKLIAEAESKAHGCPVSEVHFHEVGAMDAIADISAVSYLLNRLNIDEIISSPVNLGFGTVKCAHGILPVPAPATAYIIKGIPSYSSDIKGELCTPTGAALLKHFSSFFGEMPIMKVSKIGYGMGTKDFERANCLRVFLEEEQEEDIDLVLEFQCQVDDMTGEEVGFFINAMLEEGALDVYWNSIGMKKNRPGFLLTVIGKSEDKEKIVKAIFKHTTTLGIRFCEKQRYILKREIKQLNGVRYKSSFGYDVNREKPEFDDLERIALEKKCSLFDAEKRF